MVNNKLNALIRTQLISCEELASDETNYWQVKKLIKPLDKMIEELAAIEDSQNSTKLADYRERLNILKQLTNYETTASASESSELQHQKEALRETNQIKAGQKYASVRKDLLFGVDDTLRYRGPTEKQNAQQLNSNIPEAIKYYNVTQEKISEHMISLTRNLKEQTETANRIIKNDTQVVSGSTGMADKNLTALNKEGSKLKGYANSACRCGLCFMFIFVIFVFIGMVLFMKLFKKRAQ